MINVMLDLETLATVGNAAIVAIGACTFRDDGVVGAEKSRSTFYRVIDAEDAQREGGFICGSTVKWWMQQSAEARAIFDPAHPKLASTSVALLDFRAWLTMLASSPDKIAIWGNGADFDNAVLTSAYNRLGWQTPWKFRNNRCYRTLKNLPVAQMVEKAERYGVHHNALDDAITQARDAEAIFAAMSRLAVLANGNPCVEVAA